jgi:hypothetical protein
LVFFRVMRCNIRYFEQREPKGDGAGAAERRWQKGVGIIHHLAGHPTQATPRSHQNRRR